MVFAHLSLDEFRKVITTHVEALNHAVRDIPPERMRMHICWASTQGPHHKDVPLKDIVDIVLRGRPQAVSFPGANPRHGHEWKVWRDVKLPADKIIIPGVIDSTSNFVEHPELVADRIVQYASVVGAENVIAGVDCGFRHLRRTAAGRFEDRMDEARRPRRRRAARLTRAVVTGQQCWQRRACADADPLAQGWRRTAAPPLDSRRRSGRRAGRDPRQPEPFDGETWVNPMGDME